MKGLGRRAPKDWQHLERYPLTVTPAKPTPVVIGVNWYSAFDSPQRDAQGKWWIGTGRDLGSIRGGHCVCLQPLGAQDYIAWADFYDQGHEGACVGFGASRAMTLLNRKRYFARWLWDRAKEVDQWSDTNPGDDNGTEVRAAFQILKARGHVPWKPAFDSLNTDGEAGDAYPRSGLVAVASEGIGAYRWATTVDDVLRALGTPERDYVVLINSWGRDYPHFVRVPASVLERLMFEDGEFGIPTDR